MSTCAQRLDRVIRVLEEHQSLSHSEEELLLLLRLLRRPDPQEGYPEPTMGRLMGRLAERDRLYEYILELERTASPTGLDLLFKLLRQEDAPLESLRGQFALVEERARRGRAFESDDHLLAALAGRRRTGRCGRRWRSC